MKKAQKWKSEAIRLERKIKGSTVSLNKVRKKSPFSMVFVAALSFSDHLWQLPVTGLEQVHLSSSCSVDNSTRTEERCMQGYRRPREQQQQQLQCAQVCALCVCPSFQDDRYPPPSFRSRDVNAGGVGPAATTTGGGGLKRGGPVRSSFSSPGDFKLTMPKKVDYK